MLKDSRGKIHRVAFASMCLAAASCASTGQKSIEPYNPDAELNEFAPESRNNVAVVCSRRNRICAITYRMESNESGGDRKAGEHECRKRNRPVVQTRGGLQIEQVWTRSIGRYGERIWVVMCGQQF